LIVALCPLDNAFDTAANVAAIGVQLERCARAGAALAVFPECGLTGFKARQDLSHAHLADALAQVRAQVAQHGVSALVPTIELDACARPRNRARLFAAEGTLRALFEKTGLTPSEQQWFVTGTRDWPRTFELDGRRFGVLFCDELNQGARRFIDAPVDALLWPGYWGHGDPFDWASDGPHEAYARMRACAKDFGAPLLQVNGRRPEADAPGQNIVVLGGSVAVAPDGRLLHPFEPHRREPILVELPSP
jgi:predicted amidohydrolase